MLLSASKQVDWRLLEPATSKRARLIAAGIRIPPVHPRRLMTSLVVVRLNRHSSCYCWLQVCCWQVYTLHCLLANLALPLVAAALIVPPLSFTPGWGNTCLRANLLFVAGCFVALSRQAETRLVGTPSGRPGAFCWRLLFQYRLASGFTSEGVGLPCFFLLLHPF